MTITFYIVESRKIVHKVAKQTKNYRFERTSQTEIKPILAAAAAAAGWWWLLTQINAMLILRVIDATGSP